MPPKKLPHKTSKSSAREDEEQPDQEPDFTVEDVERRVETFLHDQRDTRRGGAGINPDTLLLRRTRAAIIAIHDRLRVYPDTSNRALARVWDMFRSMAKQRQVMRLPPGVLSPDAPLRGWIRQAIGAQREDNSLASLRNFLVQTPWPSTQQIRALEVRNKGLGPLQWWKVFGQGRRLTLKNIDRFEAARRKRKERAAKNGKVLESDDEVGSAPPPPPVIPGRKHAGPPRSAAPPSSGPQPPRANTAIPQLRRTTNQDAAQLVDATSARPQRRAAIVAATAGYADVTDVGPDSGDLEDDQDFLDSDEEEESASKGSRTQSPSASNAQKRRDDGSNSDEDELHGDGVNLEDEGDDRSAGGKGKNTGGSAAEDDDVEMADEDVLPVPAQRANRRKKAKSAAPSTPDEDGIDVANNDTASGVVPVQVQNVNKKKRLDSAPAPVAAAAAANDAAAAAAANDAAADVDVDMDDVDTLFGGDWEPGLLTSAGPALQEDGRGDSDDLDNPAVTQSRKTGVANQSTSPSWSGKRRQSSVSAPLPPSSFSRRTKTAKTKQVSIELPAPRSRGRTQPAARSVERDAEPGPSGPRHRPPVPPAPEIVEDDSSDEVEDDEEEEDEADHVGKGKGKAKAKPKEKKRIIRQSAMVQGGGVVIRDQPATRTLRSSAPPRKVAAPPGEVSAPPLEVTTPREAPPARREVPPAARREAPPARREAPPARREAPPARREVQNTYPEAIRRGYEGVTNVDMDVDQPWSAPRLEDLFDSGFGELKREDHQSHDGRLFLAAAQEFRAALHPVYQELRTMSDNQARFEYNSAAQMRLITNSLNPWGYASAHSIGLQNVPPAFVQPPASAGHGSVEETAPFANRLSPHMPPGSQDRREVSSSHTAGPQIANNPTPPTNPAPQTTAATRASVAPQAPAASQARAAPQAPLASQATTGSQATVSQSSLTEQISEQITRALEPALDDLKDYMRKITNASKEGYLKREGERVSEWNAQLEAQNQRITELVSEQAKGTQNVLAGQSVLANTQTDIQKDVADLRKRLHDLEVSRDDGTSAKTSDVHGARQTTLNNLHAASPPGASHVRPTQYHGNAPQDAMAEGDRMNVDGPQGSEPLANSLPETSEYAQPSSTQPSSATGLKASTLSDAPQRSNRSDISGAAATATPALPPASSRTARASLSHARATTPPAPPVSSSTTGITSTAIHLQEESIAPCSPRASGANQDPWAPAEEPPEVPAPDADVDVDVDSDDALLEHVTEAAAAGQKRKAPASEDGERDDTGKRRRQESPEQELESPDEPQPQPTGRGGRGGRRGKRGRR